VVQQIELRREARAGLENTDELPVLDVASYEAQLASGKANGEREAILQSRRLANLEVRLARAEALAKQAEVSRRTELQRETERANALDATRQKLVLELERTRGALDERELQMRRLERQATASAQALARIRGDIELANTSPPSETREFPDDGATLVPLDDSDAPALPLGRLTTIGRASDSDLCLKDSSVSRRHAIVTIGPKGAFIEDIRSVNGVTVNRQRVRHARLVDGDVIELGLRWFRFTTRPAQSTDSS
jgi:hypothetical protein